ncbi:putative polyadenylate-binding protein 8 [Paratrimastix pyriformis]|uniref:Polyadenylate-binding protein 8 n=1 Tax=Paratrimastix pyriformis TaxID=342808 RepID=A0ABQ8UKF4_9EUKA|nr:putative polyadenylate-binding protein 8 [Paratrimastix pyriformis]
MACPKCGQAVVRSRMPNHQQFTCLKRMVPCPRCMQMVMVGDLPVKHLEQECSRRLRDCVRGCGQRVPLSDMDEHCLRDCKNKPRPCSFHALGCEDLVGPPDQPAHNQAHLPGHERQQAATEREQAQRQLEELRAAHQQAATEQQTERQAVRQQLEEAQRQLQQLRAAHQQAATERQAAEQRQAAETTRRLDQLQAAYHRDLDRAVAELKASIQLQAATARQLEQTRRRTAVAGQLQAAETARQLEEVKAHQRDLQQAATEQKGQLDQTKAAHRQELDRTRRQLEQLKAARQRDIEHARRKAAEEKAGRKAAAGKVARLAARRKVALIMAAVGGRLAVVGNLNFKTTERDLGHLFAEVVFPGLWVMMSEAADAERAVETLDKRELDGRPIRVELARSLDLACCPLGPRRRDPATEERRAAPVAERRADPPVAVLTSKKLFVGNLNLRTTPDELGSLFAEVGEVVNVNIISRGQVSLGYGFVEMRHSEDVQRAQVVMDKKELDGHTIHVEVARPRVDPAGPRWDPATEERRLVYVGNLRSSTTRNDLVGLFPEIGDVASATTITPRGYGFVAMKSPEAAQRAVAALATKELDGHAIRAELAKPRRADRPVAPRCLVLKSKVFVGNLNSATTDDDLGSLFAEVGEVVSVEIRSQGPYSLRCHGWVTMKNPEDALLAALAMDKKELGDRTINVELAPPRVAPRGAYYGYPPRGHRPAPPPAPLPVCAPAQTATATPVWAPVPPTATATPVWDL